MRVGLNIKSHKILLSRAKNKPIEFMEFTKFQFKINEITTGIPIYTAILPDLL